MSEPSVPKRYVSISDKRSTQHDAGTESALAWRGPIAFARAHGCVRGTDYDFGIRWGPNDNQRVILRTEVGGEAGLLYVYDSTWDEYAVIGVDVPLAAVEDACARSLQFGEHSSVDDFMAFLPNAPAVSPSAGYEL